MFVLPEGTLELHKTKGKGHGIKVLKDIDAGTVVGDYVGMITRAEDVPDDGGDFYDLVWNEKVSIVADPKEMGVHLVNHSCAPNCGMFPYKGHILYFALRKIFTGEELTMSYMLNPPEPDEAVLFDICRCGTPVCRGTLYTSEEMNNRFYAFEEKMSGEYIRKSPGAFGTKLKPLGEYPANVADYPVYDIFGALDTEAVKSDETVLPAVGELRTRIRTTGRKITFPKMNFSVYGIMNGLIVGNAIQKE